VLAGFTLYYTRNQKGNFHVGLRTEKARLRSAVLHLEDLMRRILHSPIREQADHLNQVLRGPSKRIPSAQSSSMGMFPFFSESLLGCNTKPLPRMEYDIRLDSLENTGL